MANPLINSGDAVLVVYFIARRNFIIFFLEIRKWKIKIWC